MLGERTAECKTVPRRGRQIRCSNLTCIKITARHSGLTFKKEESWARSGLTEPRLGWPSQDRKPQACLRGHGRQAVTTESVSWTRPPPQEVQITTKYYKHGKPKPRNRLSEITALQIVFHLLNQWAHRQWLGLADSHSFVLSLRAFSSFKSASIYLLLLVNSECRAPWCFPEQQHPARSGISLTHI